MPRRDARPGDELTLLETRALFWVAHGLTSKQIGTKMGLTSDTVDGHLNRVFTKLRALNRAHAVALGLLRGELKLPSGGGLQATTTEGGSR